MNRAQILAVVVVAGLVGVVSWRAWTVARLGSIELTNNGPPLIAQLLPKTGDEPLGEAFDVVTRATLSLPAGDYRLRVHGVGRLGRTFRFAINRGETRSHALALDEGRLLRHESTRQVRGESKQSEEPIPYASATVALTLTPGKADFIERSPQALVRRDGVTGKVIWEVTRGPDPQAWRRIPTTWLDHLLSLTTDPLSCRLVEPPADLNGDGTADLIWYFRDFAAVLAVAGTDGSILWNYSATLGGSGGPRPDGPDVRRGPTPNQLERVGAKPEEPGGRWRRLIGRPATADADGDGTPDLIATVALSETEDEITQRTGIDPNGRQVVALQRRIVVAVSGRTGQEIWNHPLDEAFTTLAQVAFQRPVKAFAARGWVGLSTVEGDRWVGLDAATGQPRLGPVDLGFAPVRPVQVADLDGDGDPEILARGPGPTLGVQTLAVFAGTTGRPLWTEPLRLSLVASSNPITPPEGLFVVDLDGDGRPEIAVPDAGPMPPGPGWRGLQLLDGATGRTRWSRPMRPDHMVTGDGLVEVADAPDLDADGVRDLVTTSYFLGRSPASPTEGDRSTPERVYVDAISGRDGHPLWWWHRAMPTDTMNKVLPLRWWGRGPDGWPLLALRMGGVDSRSANNMPPNPPIVHNLEASTGRDVATAVGLDAPGVADLDGDGLLDLWGEANGQLTAFRGEPPTLWRTLGLFGPADPPRDRADLIAPPSADLDGDGIADLLSTDLQTQPRTARDLMASPALEPNLSRGFPTSQAPTLPPSTRPRAVARSGRDGRLIWSTPLDESWLRFGDEPGGQTTLTAHPLPGGDFDGDGTADVVVQTVRYTSQPGGFEFQHAATVPLRALSGRSGRQLWSAGPLPLGFRAVGDSQVQWTRGMVIEPGGAADLVVGHLSPFDSTAPPAPGPNAPVKPRLARVSGQTGQILWDVALSDQSQPSGWSPPRELGFGDVDGDGPLDFIGFALASNPTGGEIGGLEVRAISLRDGRVLWAHRLDFGPNPDARPELVVADLDGDGRAEVIVSDRPETGGQPGYAVKALDGRDGQVLWTFRADAFITPSVTGSLFLAHFNRQNPPSVGLSFGSINHDVQGVRQIIILDQHGRVRADQNLAGPPDGDSQFGGSPIAWAVDLTGDGRDEILAFSRAQTRVWGPDFHELWARPNLMGDFDRVIPGLDRQPGTLLFHHPLSALDGGDGHPRWSVGNLQAGWGPLRSQWLDLGGSTRPPRFLTHSANGTTCFQAIPTAPDGSVEPPRGSPVSPGLARDDPRWTRPLPWVEWVDRPDGWSIGLALVGLALVNFGLPLALLRLVAGRRWRSLRLVMALPAAAAIPIIVFKTLEPSLPPPPAPLPSSPALVLLIGSLAGMPILVWPAVAGWAVARRRWRALAWFVGLMALMGLAIGAVWILRDQRTMPPIEQYDWSGWAWPLAPGALVASVLVPLGWSARRAANLVARRR